jgi:hypothetical protein
MKLAVYLKRIPSPRTKKQTDNSAVKVANNLAKDFVKDMIGCFVVFSFQKVFFTFATCTHAPRTVCAFSNVKPVLMPLFREKQQRSLSRN